MVTLVTTNPTLLDLQKSLDPDGRIAPVIEILNATNRILDDMTWIEGNLPTGHRSTIRTGLPTPTWRKLYGGVQPTKSTRVQVTDNTGMLEAYAEVDKALADLNGNTAEFRLSEDRPHIEGMGQEMAQTIFYGSEVSSPEEFTGLAPRFANLTADANSDNIIDGGSAGGQTDNASIWLIGWSPTTVFGIVPKGSSAGLQFEDKGQVTIEDVDGSGGRMEAYRSWYQWRAGLVVADWRYVVRICNIDKSLLLADASSGANLPDLMFEATEIIPNLDSVRASFYMSRDIITKVRQQSAAGVSSSTLMIEEVGGVKRTTFSGIPLARCDALSADETRLT